MGRWNSHKRAIENSMLNAAVRRRIAIRRAVCEPVDYKLMAGSLIAPTPSGIAGPIVGLYQSARGFAAAPQAAAAVRTTSSAKPQPSSRGAARPQAASPVQGRAKGLAATDDVLHSDGGSSVDFLWRRDSAPRDDDHGMSWGVSLPAATGDAGAVHQRPVNLSTAVQPVESWLGRSIAQLAQAPASVAQQTPRPPPMQSLQSAPPAVGSGTGLTRLTYSGGVSDTRTLSTTPSDTWSASGIETAWFGQLQAEAEGTYHLSIASTNATVLLTVDGEVVPGAGGDFTFAAGSMHDVHIHVQTTGSAATAGFEWTKPGTSTAVTVPTSALYPATEGQGDGLLGTYFSATNLGGTTSAHIDTRVDFTTAPAASARWLGQVVPHADGAYSFSFANGAYSRIWVNDELAYSNTFSAGNTTTFPITLERGQRYDLRAEYLSGAAPRLMWSSASQPAEVIPASQLFATTGFTPTATGASSTQSDGSYVLTLGATGDGAAEIDHWSVDWGDGVTQIYAANITTVNHLFPNRDAAYNIVASAVLPDGSFKRASPILNATFASGTATTTVPTGWIPMATKQASDGSVAVAGAVLAGGSPYLTVYRFTSAGVLDASFGSGGAFTTTISGALDGVAIADDLSFYTLERTVVGADLVISTSRYTASGLLDTTFGVSGKYSHTYVNETADAAANAAWKIALRTSAGAYLPVLAGVTQAGSTKASKVLLVSATGTEIAAATIPASVGDNPDRPVGLPAAGNPPRGSQVVTAIAATASGAAIVTNGVTVTWIDAAGTITPGTKFSHSIAYAAANSDGSLLLAWAKDGELIAHKVAHDLTTVTAFGDNGFAFAGTEGISDATGIQVLSDGRFILTGTTRGSGSEGANEIVRLNADGSRDSAWASGGAYLSDFGTNSVISAAAGGSVVEATLRSGSLNVTKYRSQSATTATAYAWTGASLNASGGVTDAVLTYSIASGQSVTLEMAAPGDLNYHTVPAFVPDYSSGSHTYTVTGLAADSNYHFRLKAVQAGVVHYVSAFAVTAEGATSVTAPVSVQQVVGSGSSPGVSFDWNPANDTNAATQFTVTVRSLSSAMPQPLYARESEEHQYTILAENYTANHIYTLYPDLGGSQDQVAIKISTGISESAWIPLQLAQRPAMPLAPTIAMQAATASDGSMVLAMGTRFTGELLGLTANNQVVSLASVEGLKTVTLLAASIPSSVQQIVAFDGTNYSAPIIRSSTTLVTPNAPKDLAVTRTTDGRSLITWDNPDGNEWGYKIQRLDVSSTASLWSDVAVLQADQTSVTDVTPSTQNNYLYRAVATNADGESQDDSPAGPSAINAAVVKSSYIQTPFNIFNLGVYWTDNSDDELGFVVQQSEDPSFSSPQVRFAAANATSLAYTPSSARGYYFRVAAYSAAGVSEYSLPTYVVIPANNFRVTGTSTTSSINLAWDAGSSSATAIIERRPMPAGGSYDQTGPGAAYFGYVDGGSDYDSSHPLEAFERIASIPASQGVYTDNAVENGITYDYRIHIQENGHISDEMSSFFNGYYPTGIGPNIYDNSPHVTTSAKPEAPILSGTQTASGDNYTEFSLEWNKKDANVSVRLQYSSDGIHWSNDVNPEYHMQAWQYFDEPTRATIYLGRGVTQYCRAFWVTLTTVSDPSNVVVLSSSALSAPPNPDNYKQLVTLSLSASGATFAEGGAASSATFTISRTTYSIDQLNNPLTIQLRQSGGNADTDDYSGFLTSVTIPAHQVTSTFTISITDDTEKESAENAVFEVVPTSSYVVTSNWTGASGMLNTVFIDDNDWVDVDVDSDNDEGNVLSRSTAEDQAEDDSAEPGKIVVVNDDDSDADSVPGYADGYSLSNSGTSRFDHFTQMTFQVAPGIDLTNARFRFQYAASDPLAVDSADYSIPEAETGSLRIWTADGNVQRNGHSIAEQGNYIEPDVAYSAYTLGFNPSGSNNTYIRDGRTFYIEAIKPSTAMGDLTITFEMDPTGTGDFSISDVVRLTAVKSNIAADNNRDGSITLDKKDDTSEAKPFLFWLNDNRDVWGGDDYPAAETVSSNQEWGDIDSQSAQIGSLYNEKGQTVTGAAAIKEVAQRDLEDFAPIGFTFSGGSVSPASSAHITGFRIRLESASDPGMKLRLWHSARKAGEHGEAFDATANVTDPTTTDATLAKVDWAGNTGSTKYAGVELTVGGSHTYDNDIFSQFTDGAYFDPVSKQIFVQLLVEGIGKGTGKLVFEVMHDDHVLSSSSMYLNLRPMKELYDHYSVSYGQNVAADGTLKNNISVLTSSQPVPTTAQLVGGGSKEAKRFKSQSSDYFVFIHGYRNNEQDRIAAASQAYKRMFWSGYKGQFGWFDWPTQWAATADEDAGLFDRSEFAAWNSGIGLKNTLATIRSDRMAPDGKLSVVAHSMGNLVLDEALHLAEGQTFNNHKLVDTAIQSQAAVSSHYFDGLPPSQASPPTSIPSIYKVGNNPDLTAHVTFGPSVTYTGFPTTGAIGGSEPRFRNIAGSAGKIFDYYNPDDYALTMWKLSQALKPTGAHISESTGVLTTWAYSAKEWIDWGNVVLPSTWDLFVNGAITNGFSLNPKPGFGSTSYAYNATTGSFERTVSKLTTVVQGQAATTIWLQVGPSVPLTFASNAYEMFSFGASSIVSPLGLVSASLFPSDIFTGGGRDLRTFTNSAGTTNWNTLSPGHSAQLVGAFVDVQGYWRQVVTDTGASS